MSAPFWVTAMMCVSFAFGAARDMAFGKHWFALGDAFIAGVFLAVVLTEVAERRKAAKR